MSDSGPNEYLTVNQVAELLQISHDSVARRFEALPGVLDLGTPERTHKRRRRLLRIPKSVLVTFLSEHSVR